MANAHAGAGFADASLRPSLLSQAWHSADSSLRPKSAEALAAWPGGKQPRPASRSLDSVQRCDD